MAKKATKAAPPAPQTDWQQVLHEAQQRFGIKRFRPGQKEVLTAVFAGRDCLALMPTGAGKSLTYQLPACFLPRPVVVVSPLIALMQDQQAKAEQAEITSESLNSTLRHAEAMLAEHQIAEHIAQLIYVTPERLQSEDFLQQLESSGGISLLVVDEAHTIVQWGHDFRPAFQAIGDARRRLGNPPVLALTATATEDVQSEIVQSLHMHDEVRINTGTERGNLFFSVHPTVNNAAKFDRIQAMLEREQGTGIIYTASVKSADELFAYLTDRGISVGHYHGKMTPKDRREVQERFMRGEHKVMIATKAFGLGIDKPDIRFVYHFEFPDSLETYYQEAGRAGRDGANAHAVLLYRLEDKRIQSFFLAGRYPKPAELEAVYQEIAGNVMIGASADDPQVSDENASAENPSPEMKISKRRKEVILNLLREAGLIRRTANGHELDPGSHANPEQLAALLQTYVDRAARDQQHLAEMMHYAETPGCRTGVIRSYFGDHEGEPCLRCDNCAQEHAHRMPEPHLELLGRKPPQSVSVPEPVQTHREQVQTIETMHGSYQTTHHLEAAAPDAAFQKGDQVRHARFGAGKVLEINEGVALVDFQKGGSKRLRIDFLEAA